MYPPVGVVTVVIPSADEPTHVSPGDATQYGLDRTRTRYRPGRDVHSTTRPWASWMSRARAPGGGVTRAVGCGSAYIVQCSVWATGTRPAAPERTRAASWVAL